MCFMDWRIGRLIRSQIRQIAPQGGSVCVIPANMQRVGLTILCPYGATAAILLDFGASPNLLAQVCASSTAPFHITLATHGDLPTKALRIQPWFAAGSTITIIEYTVPEDVLTLGLEMIQREYPGHLKY